MEEQKVPQSSAENETEEKKDEAVPAQLPSEAPQPSNPTPSPDFTATIDLKVAQQVTVTTSQTPDPSIEVPSVNMIAPMSKGLSRKKSMLDSFDLEPEFIDKMERIICDQVTKTSSDLYSMFTSRFKDLTTDFEKRIDSHRQEFNRKQQEVLATIEVIRSEQDGLIKKLYKA